MHCAHVFDLVAEILQGLSQLRDDLLGRSGLLVVQGQLGLVGGVFDCVQVGAQGVQMQLQ